MNRYVVIAYLPESVWGAAVIEDAVRKGLDELGIEPRRVDVQVPAARTIKVN